jgi:hypothetical protein
MIYSAVFLMLEYLFFILRLVGDIGDYVTYNDIFYLAFSTINLGGLL